jgi:hypothetical protein
MRFGRFLGFVIALVVSAGVSTSAWAQSYTVATATQGSQWITPPATNTTAITFSSYDDSVTAISTTPFPIPYWGTTYNSCVVGSNGTVWIGGYATTSTIYSPLTMPIASGATNDGMVAVQETDCYGANANKACKYWVDGTTPNRRFVIAWLNWDTYASSYGGTQNFQVQFGENGVITMSYYPNSSWDSTLISGENSIGAGVGLDRPTHSTDFIKPTSNSGVTSPAVFITPTHDYVFAPPVIQISGSVTYDRYIVNSSGIGNQSEANLPLANIRIEQRDGTGAVIGSGYTNASGVYNFQGKKDATITNGSIVVASGGVASNVRSVASGALYSFPLAANQSFAADLVVAATNINELQPRISQSY